MIERIFERYLYASRWLQAPLYAGLTAMLLALAIKFFQELWHMVPALLTMGDQDLVLASLSMIDLVLVANLIVMVVIAGYENFVSQINMAADGEVLSWVGKLDSGTLKLKVAASIVSISSIHLLREFVEADAIRNDKLMWLVIIQLTFVVTAVLMGVLDRLVFSGHGR